MRRRYLKDLAEEWRCLGEAQFAAGHDWPALVGVALAAEVRQAASGGCETHSNLVLDSTRVVEARSLVGSVWPLTEPGPSKGGRLRVGRLPDSDLVIQDFSVSNRHAEIHLAAEGIQVVDLASKYGTFVNDVRLQAYAAFPLGDWDLIQLGRLQFSFLTPESLRQRVARLAGLLPPKFVNRRTAHRAAVRGTCRIECRLANQAFGPSLAEATVNLSQTGIGIISSRPLAIGETVEILCGDFAGGALVKLPSTVIWCRPCGPRSYRVGLRFQSALPYREFQMLVKPV